MPSARARLEWANRVQAEYRSAVSAARTVHLLLLCGLDEELARDGMRIVTDELDHARLSHEVRLALGGGDAPVPVEMAVPAASPPLPELVDLAVRDFCLGETFAVPLFAAMRLESTLPEVRAALERILRDEARHRQFGWDLLDALLEVDGETVRARVQLRLPGWLEGFRLAYGLGPSASPLTPEEEAAGLMAPARYNEVHDRCLAEDILPRLHERGIS